MVSKLDRLPSGKDDVRQAVLNADGVGSLYTILTEELGEDDAAWRPSTRRKIESSVLWYGLSLPNGKATLPFGIKVTGEIVIHFGMMANEKRPPFNDETKRIQYCELLGRIPSLSFEDNEWNKAEVCFPVELIADETNRIFFVKAVNWFICEVINHIGPIDLMPETHHYLKAEIPPPTQTIPHERMHDFVGRKVDWEGLGKKKRAVGIKGEEWVINFERERLNVEGRSDLAGMVEWVSEIIGDGLGYDVKSFNSDGSERHIEVKSSWREDIPFFVTLTELEYSRTKPDLFYLYRVFNFKEKPSVYILQGDISKNFNLMAETYSAKR